MKHIIFLITLSLLSSASFASSLNNIADKIVADEVEHREKIRQLQRDAEIAEIESKIRTLDSTGNEGIDIGISSGSANDFAAISHTTKHDSETPIIIGYRDGKGVFRYEKNIVSAGKNDPLPGGFKVLDVDTDSALIRSPSGRTIEQSISWGITSVDDSHE